MKYTIFSLIGMIFAFFLGATIFDYFIHWLVARWWNGVINENAIVMIILSDLVVGIISFILTGAALNFPPLTKND